MRTPVLFGAVIAAACLLGSAARAATWLKVQSDDVVIYSDASPKDVVGLAVGYSAYRHAFQQLFAPASPPPATVLVVFRRLSTLQKHIPASTDEDSEMISFSTVVDGQALVALALDGDRTIAMQRTLEFDTIWSLGRCGYFLPIWMSQGAGEVLSSLELRKASYLIGDGPSGFQTAWGRGTSLPWPKFFEVSTESPEYSGKEATGDFHTQAWALMHRILLPVEDGRNRFSLLAGKLRTTWGLEAVETALGLKENAFDREISRHLNSAGAIVEVPFDVEGLRRRLVPIPAPREEVHIQLANLLLAAGKKERAVEELEAARGIAPQSPAVKEACARQVMLENGIGKAVELYREAIEVGSTNAMAYLLSAQHRLNDSSLFGRGDRAGDGGLESEKAAEEVRKAIALNPGISRGYVLLGRVFFVLPKVGPEHVDELSRGLGFDADGEQIRYYRALLHQRLGNTGEYVADLRHVANSPLSPPNLRKASRERVARHEADVTSKEVKRLVDEKKFTEARAFLKERAAADPETTDQKAIERLGGWIDENADWHSLYETYRARQWPAIAVAAEAFLKKHPKSRTSQGARRILDQAQQQLRRSKAGQY